MRKSKFREAETIRILKEAETSKSIRKICREHRIASATFYRWQSLYGRMEVSELVRQKELKQENRRIKQMFADTVNQ